VDSDPDAKQGGIKQRSESKWPGHPGHQLVLCYFLSVGFASGGVMTTLYWQSSCGHLCTVPSRFVVFSTVTGKLQLGQACGSG
jgi:hypothetical protein